MSRKNVRRFLNHSVSILYLSALTFRGKLYKKTTFAFHIFVYLSSYFSLFLQFLNFVFFVSYFHLCSPRLSFHVFRIFSYIQVTFLLRTYINNIHIIYISLKYQHFNLKTCFLFFFFRTILKASTA